VCFFQGCFTNLILITVALFFNGLGGMISSD